MYTGFESKRKRRHPAGTHGRLLIIIVASLYLGNTFRTEWYGNSPRQLNSQVHETATQHSAIVVTVRGALEYFVDCIESWSRTTEDSHMFIVDDCDSTADRAKLEALAILYRNVTLLKKETDERIGYTRAVNMGLRRAYDNGFSVIVQLNSDTVLTSHWLTPLLAVLRAEGQLGAIGPISNAATWQSVPDLTGEDNMFALNPLPFGWDAEMVAKLAFLLSDNVPIELPILVGFAIAYKREVLQHVGFMDELRFPIGYGEENDYAMRMLQHNYTLAVMPSSYVYHHKGKTFSSKESEKLGHKAWKANEVTYGTAFLESASRLRENQDLERMRAGFKKYFQVSFQTLRCGSVVFILNVMPQEPFQLRGGWIALVQEAEGLWRNGFHVRIVVPGFYMTEFSQNFPVANAGGLFQGFYGKVPVEIAEEILKAGVIYDFIVATHFSTVETVMKLSAAWPNSVPSYYVQDIESRFADDANDVAARSYRLLGGGFVFVKTAWMQRELASEFNVSSVVIPPTVDTDFFTAGDQDYRGPLQLCAMIRVSTPWRNPKETLQILTWAMRTFGPERVNATAFGSEASELAAHVTRWDQAAEIELSLLNIVGTLDRSALRSLNKRCEVFLDFSQWQAFGQSGIEAMASGVVPILPENGGGSEYATRDVDSFFVDTSDTSNAQKVLTEIVGGKHDMLAMRKAAVKAARAFSLKKSAQKTARIFRQQWDGWRAARSAMQR